MNFTTSELIEAMSQNNKLKVYDKNGIIYDFTKIQNTCIKELKKYEPFSTQSMLNKSDKTLIKAINKLTDLWESKPVCDKKCETCIFSIEIPNKYQDDLCSILDILSELSDYIPQR